MTSLQFYDFAKCTCVSVYVCTTILHDKFFFDKFNVIVCHHDTYKVYNTLLANVLLGSNNFDKFSLLTVQTDKFSVFTSALLEKLVC